MSNKVNTSPPTKQVGARRISKEIENLSLSREAMSYLGAISGKLQITICGETLQTTHRVVDQDDNFLCTTRELESLAGYKSFINSKKELIESGKTHDVGIMTLHNLKRLFRAENTGITCPDRMLDANRSKHGQIKREIDILEKNVSVVETLPNSEERNYILRNGSILKKILLKSLVQTVGPDKLEQSFIKERLLGCCVPQYFYTKFVDPNFTKDARDRADTLIFPKGNFMKTISFTTEELRLPTMREANRIALSQSNCIVRLATRDELRDLFIRDTDEHAADLHDQWEKFSWPMLAPGSIDDYLKPRLDRVNVKSFSPTLALRARPGDRKVFRSESLYQKKVRELKNSLGKVLGTIIEFFHFMPKVDDPFEDFWKPLFFPNEADEEASLEDQEEEETNPSAGEAEEEQDDDTQAQELESEPIWEVSPEKTLYYWINNSQSKEIVLTHIKNNSLDLISSKLMSIVGMSLDMPFSSPRFGELCTALENMGENLEPVDLPGSVIRTTDVDELPDFTYDEVKNSDGVTEQIRSAVNTFRGLQTQETKTASKAKGLRARYRVNKQVSRLLLRITDPVLGKSIEKWIGENFSKLKLQEAAAEFVVAAIEDEDLGYESSDYEGTNEVEYE